MFQMVSIQCEEKCQEVGLHIRERLYKAVEDKRNMIRKPGG